MKMINGEVSRTAAADVNPPPPFRAPHPSHKHHPFIGPIGPIGPIPPILTVRLPLQNPHRPDQSVKPSQTQSNHFAAMTTPCQLSPIRPIRYKSAICNPQFPSSPVKPSQTQSNLVNLYRWPRIATGGTIYCGFSGTMHNLWFLARQSAIRNPQSAIAVSL
jgi:hypothetical protein